MSTRDDIAATLAIGAQLRSLNEIVEAVRGLTTGLLDAWETRQLAPSTARLYRWNVPDDVLALITERGGAERHG